MSDYGKGSKKGHGSKFPTVEGFQRLAVYSDIFSIIRISASELARLTTDVRVISASAWHRHGLVFQLAWSKDT